jgi:hypothetical protein
MRFRNIPMMLVAGAAAMSMGVAGTATVPPIGGDDLSVRQRPTRRGKGQNNRRGKGVRAKQRKRPNRLTISKRIRRKHRRAS